MENIRLYTPEGVDKPFIQRSSQEQIPLRKHAYSNIIRILPPKNENFYEKFW